MTSYSFQTLSFFSLVCVLGVYGFALCFKCHPHCSEDLTELSPKGRTSIMTRKTSHRGETFKNRLKRIPAWERKKETYR